MSKNEPKSFSFKKNAFAKIAKEETISQEELDMLNKKKELD